MARLLHLPELLVSTLADHTVGEPEPRDRTTTHHHHLSKAMSRNHLLEEIAINKVKVPPEQDVEVDRTKIQNAIDLYGHLT